MSIKNMHKKALIYIIDDDRDICDLACSELEYYGYDIRVFNTGTLALQALRGMTPALCIIDLGLPDMDGMALVKALSDKPDVGVLILSGRGSLPDRVLGLELGGDDYITKPFEPRDLVARVHSLMRRLGLSQENRTPDRGVRKAQFAQWLYIPTTLTLSHSSGKNYTLSTAEGDLLNTLLGSNKQILSRDRLLGEQAIPYDRSIDSRMSRLRKKIEDNPKEPQIIKTVYGAGYIFAVDVSWIE
ncbi:response regulator transcription factor [uncultured Amphritea sp.]|uniref:response regulator transcription factor n=1 Tax=Amphritea sp. TaxID=1872502 RepID=UPI0025F4B537|nr:response regulator transcription factor [uncultured Amphritea sp.]